MPQEGSGRSQEGSGRPQEGFGRPQDRFRGRVGGFGNAAGQVSGVSHDRKTGLLFLFDPLSGDN